jgi:hypothetical protein
MGVSRQLNALAALPPHTLNGKLFGLQILFGPFEEEKNFFSLPEI